MRVCRLPLILPGLLAAGLTVSGCAVPGAPGAAQTAGSGESIDDPYENANRAVFGFNQDVDKAVLVPVAKAYRTVVPKPVRQSLHDFLQNLNGPVIFANDVLQGQPGLAAKTFGRLAINTTIGIGGFFDVATKFGIPYHANDLGITLARWGFVSGPYLIVPVLGPSNPRDLIGQVGDGFGDPGDYFAGPHLFVLVLARAVASGIDERERNLKNLADIERTALDYYATIRSLYRQRRAAEIRHEQSNLPNPAPMQGGQAPDAPISYSVAPAPQPKEVPAK